MANDPKEIDFDNMSDEDFLKLNEEDFSGNVPEGETTLSNNEATDESAQVTNEELPQDDGGDVPPANGDVPDESDPDGDPDQPTETPEGEAEGGQDPMAGEGGSVPEENQSEGGEQPPADPEEKGENEKPDEKVGQDTPAKAGYFKLPEGMDTAKVTEAISFFEIMTTPFKADGKDFTVRSPEDAIRFIQQGVNYSRRMADLKPMKQMHRVLQDHGLADAEKMNFLIDVSKGDKAAITQLLKSHNIDPMDLDIEKDSGYQARNYQGNPQDHDFRDALDTALTSPEGQALVTDIHRNWDAKSKARLREDPSILGTLQGFKASGVYDKVVEELRYQQSLGYLQGVPFLQAFDQVGEAMKNAGVFDAPQDPATSGSSMAPIRTQPQNQPVATGGRKPQAPKNPVANPHLSSTPPSRQSAQQPAKTIDFDKMSDEEFAKMAPPE